MAISKILAAHDREFEGFPVGPVEGRKMTDEPVEFLFSVGLRNDGAWVATSYGDAPAFLITGNTLDMVSQRALRAVAARDYNEWDLIVEKTRCTKKQGADLFCPTSKFVLSKRDATEVTRLREHRLRLYEDGILAQAEAIMRRRAK